MNAYRSIIFFNILYLVLLTDLPYAAKLAKVGVIDQNVIMVLLKDGEVTHRDDGIGPNAFTNNYHEEDIDTIKECRPFCNTSAAQQASNWTLTATNDPDIGSSGVNPKNCYRKTKLNGHAERAWQGSDFAYESTYEHTLFLCFSQTLKQGNTYTLNIAGSVNADKESHTFTYDIYKSVSEAVHVNLVGYHPDPTMKSADLFQWVGDGGARDYSSFEGNKVFLYNTTTNQPTEVGVVSFWKKSGLDVGWYNLTRSSVWNADFSQYTTTGTYRLAIEGVGCSQDFIISQEAYFYPYMVSTQGFFYMRIGQDSTGGISPVPRRPLYIPGESPSNTKVYITTMNPFHPEWKTFSSGDAWDKPDDWARFRKPGNPMNNKAMGGHSDARDWDRHLGHISIIYDLLLPFYLTNGVLKEDNLDIAESGNGIPDLLDEARNEVDFWLSARDGVGYSFGLTNPNKNNEFFQAGTSTFAAWANAANAAMLADCYRIAGLKDLMEEYRDSALAAYSYASTQADQMLDRSHEIGDAGIRGRDLKMMAAASLYNITGHRPFEDSVKLLSIVTNSNSALVDERTTTQTWATALYLMTKQPIHYPQLHAHMRSSVIAQAKTKEANLFATRPSRRSTPNNFGYFRSCQNVHHTIIAHAVAQNKSDKTFFRKALVLEADYSLGRNTLNMIQMTTASTPLENKRSVHYAYTSGHDDGTPGMHPGHTPYFNLDNWMSHLAMGSPSRLYQKCYPQNFKTTWPIDEGYFDTKYVWAHSEFTPRQTMRGKMALYAYLHAIRNEQGSSIFADPGPYHPNQRFSFDKKSVVRITLFDMKGRMIQSSCDYTTASILSRHLSSGVYFIEYRLRNGTILKSSYVKL